MKEVPDSTNVTIQLFGKREARSDQAREALSKGIISDFQQQNRSNRSILLPCLTWESRAFDSKEYWYGTDGEFHEQFPKYL